MRTKEELLGNPSLVLLLNGGVREFDGLAKKDVMNIESAAFTIGEVDKILKSPTEEQSECEFCHDKYGNASTLKMYLEDTGKQYEEEEAYLEKIQYCEVCGRYLE